MSFEISAAAFDSIIRSLRSDAKVSSDKRKAPRVGLSGRVTIIPCSATSERKPVTAMVRDLSRSGIGLAHANNLADGEQIIVRFSATDEEPAKSILCLVTHSQKIGEHLSTTGAKFIRDIESAAPAAPPPRGSAKTSNESKSKPPKK